MPNLLACTTTLIGIVTHVVDGDTFDLDDDLRIRLAGIDAPELASPGGDAARRALDSLITGRQVTCRPEGTSYNRIVAQCRIGDADIGGYLVRSGHARPVCRFDGARYNAAARAAGATECR